MLAPCRAGTGGTHCQIATMLTSAMTVTSPYIARQPSCWPRAVDSGTPTIVATVRPTMTSETDRARRWGGEMAAATTAVSPK